MQDQPPTPVRGWTVVIAALSINLILGVLYAWSVMGKALVQQWHWTKTQAMLPFATSTASFAVTMIFAGRWQDKIGPRYVAMLGGIILGLGMVLSSFVQGYVPMLITFGLVGGMGIGLGYSATTPPSIKWFPPAKKGLVTGIVVSGVGLAAVYMSPLTNYLLKVITIQHTFLTLGIGTIVLVSLLAQLLRNPPAGYVASSALAGAASQAKPAAASRRDLDWQEMLRTSQFYRLWLMFILSASAGLLIIGNISLIAQDQTPKWDKAFILVMVVAIFNTCGRFLSGFVSDRIGRTNTMILAFVLQAINMFVFVRYNTPALLLFGSAFTGLCYGTIFTLFPAATADFYGVRNLGVNYGSLFTAFGVAGVTGSVLGGRVRDVFGSYTYAFTICGIMLLVGAALAFTVKAPRMEAAAAPPSPDSGPRPKAEPELAKK
jgi:OFA family oxalate/formate antiporter-like MFS transporter